MRLIPAFVLLLTLHGLLTPNTSQAQDSTQKAWTPPYKMDIPTGWGTEHFSLPPGFDQCFAEHRGYRFGRSRSSRHFAISHGEGMS